ncbi:MAG: IPTL-CTERM sorting domain-containing protein [Burkholderiales bacterium]|nr:IPTL-CTERM sorting domain-containing protein [Burkholderiales bacterium]
MSLLSRAVAVAAASASLAAAAATFTVTFPEVDGTINSSGFPLPSVTAATVTLPIPAGQVITGATASGFWGSTTFATSTAGVDVFVDGVRIAQCVKPDAGCYSSGSGQRPWSYTYSAAQLGTLGDGSATLTYVQTSESVVRLGTTTLTITTTDAVVPTLNDTALLALSLLVGLGAFAALRARRRTAL